MQTLKILTLLKHSISRCAASLLHDQNCTKIAERHKKRSFLKLYPPPHKNLLNLLKTKCQKFYVFINKTEHVNKNKGTMRRITPSKPYLLRDKTCNKRIHTKMHFSIDKNKIHHTTPQDITNINSSKL